MSKKSILFLLLLITISFAYKFQYNSSYIVDESITTVNNLKLGGEDFLVLRCATTAKIITPDDEIINYTADGASMAKFAATDSEIHAFILEEVDEERGMSRIISQRLYPTYGSPEGADIPIIIEEWFPQYSEEFDNLVIFATENADTGRLSEDFFVQKRNISVMLYPDIDIFTNLYDCPVPVETEVKDDYLIVYMEQMKRFRTSYSYTSFDEQTVTDHSVWYFNLDLTDTLKTEFLGIKGYEDYTRNLGEENESYDRTTHSIVVGKSTVDLDEDGFVDIPHYHFQLENIKEEYEEPTEEIWNAIVISGDSLASADTILEYNYLFFGDFYAGTYPTLILNNWYFRGARLKFYEQLTEWDSLYTQYVHGFGNFDDDEFDEIYGTWDNELRIFDIVPTDARVDFRSGWNMICLPYDYDHTRVDRFFSFLIPPSYRYNPETHLYDICDSMVTGEGYFTLSPIDTTVIFTGDSVETIHLELQPGWNMCGGFSEWVPASVFEDVPGVVIGPYVYDPFRRNYLLPEYILPGQAFLLLTFDSITIDIPLP